MLGMAKSFEAMRTIPPEAGYGPGDVMIVFGELFQRGYANGIVDQAKACGMKVLFSTVGRRESEGPLRALNASELAEKDQPLVNIPLEAGFDMSPAEDGQMPIDQLKGLKLSDWENAKLEWKKLEQSKKTARESFRNRVREYLAEVEKQIPPGANLLFVHTMAGGVPRAKIIMPVMNRVFKGHGDRYASSEEFWNGDLGRFASESFYEVTAETYRDLIELSEGLRSRKESEGKKVSYVAYGYHGTEVLCGEKYQWQSYSPYLQGFAKIRLEEVAEEAWQKGIKASVFNAPEILTNSSSVFLGVEISLYALLGALRKEAGSNPKVQEFCGSVMAKMKTEVSEKMIMDRIQNYLESEVIKKWSIFPKWPQHNGPEQMMAMREASTDLIDMHKDPKQMITSDLSELVFTACGGLMFRAAWSPQKPVWWIGHDVVAKFAAINL